MQERCLIGCKFYLDFVKELDSLGDINDHVGSSLVGTEAPDLSAVIDVPLVFLGKVSGSGLDVITGSDLLVFNLVRKTVGEGEGFHVETVVLKYELNFDELIHSEPY